MMNLVASNMSRHVLRSAYAPTWQTLATGGRSPAWARLSSLGSSVSCGGGQQRTSVPPVADVLINGLGPVLHLAPRSAAWARDASRQVVFASMGSRSTADVLRLIERHRPMAMVVADQPVSRSLLSAWRSACAGGPLLLVRRGTSTDRIDLAACRDLGIEVVNTPGINAPHVADWIVRTLKDSCVSWPRELVLIGHGHVGQAVTARLRDANAPSRALVLTRQRPSEPGSPPPLEKAMAGASAVVVCASTNDGSIGMIEASHIESLKPGAVIVCVSKPAVFSDSALRCLAARSDVRLCLDYGPDTLAEFERRLADLGCPVSSWRVAPRFTSDAATSPDAHRDLDRAVALRLATAALDRVVNRAARSSLALPTQPLPASAPRVDVVGCGINGLLQAFMLRLAGLNVTVHGSAAASEGASHKPVDMRHLSATETSARGEGAPAMMKLHGEFIVACNLAGIRLFEQMLADNPSLQSYARARLVRVYPRGGPDHASAMAAQVAIASRPWPGGEVGEPAVEIDADAFAAAHGVANVERALQVPGYDLAFRGFMSQLRGLLRQAGVEFTGARLDPGELAAIGTSARPAVTAMGAEEDGVLPVQGWFLRLAAAGGEARELRGVKLQYPLPVGVMNCRRDGDDILVSGAQVPPGLPADEVTTIQTMFLQAVERHFPRSIAAAREHGPLDLTICVRPGSADGLSRVQWSGPHRIMAGATTAGGTTQGPLWAVVVAEELSRSFAKVAVPGEPVLQ